MVESVEGLWRKYRALFHIFALLLTLGTTYGVMKESLASQVTATSANTQEITALKARYDLLIDNVSSIRLDTAVTKQQVADIKESIADIKQALNIPLQRQK
jgi:hypothetical protein